MMIGDELHFNVSMLGPTRVGKTSIIASMLQGGQQLLIGTPVTMGAADAVTEQRIIKTRRALLGSLHAGEFKTDSLQSTSEPQHYNILLDPGVDGAGVRFDLLDFPGEWLNAMCRPAGRQQEWAECLRFVESSSVLIVPVDAAVLMEASLEKYKGAWRSILTMDEVEQVASRWAATRKMRADEPALVLFCPVKCESYFADNGGLKDRSDELFSRFLEVYGEVVNLVRGQFAGARQLYCPIDTLGWVELLGVEWIPSADEDSGWRFQPTFTLRADARSGTSKLRTKGVDDFLAALCNQLLNARKVLDTHNAMTASTEFASAQEKANRREGLFKDMWLWANRERARRRRLAAETGRAAAETRSRLESLEKVMRDIAGRERGHRVRDL